MAAHLPQPGPDMVPGPRAAAGRYTSFRQFYPFYLSEHANRTCRRLHFAGSLLVLGSSLTVMSGYRFVLRAAKLGIPVAIVNSGPTRGDAKATHRVDAPLGLVLPELAGRLT